MAGVELNIVSAANLTTQVSSNAPAQENIRRTPEVSTAEAAKVRKQDEAEKTRRQDDATLENVVARSKDGDTVQVSDDGATELEESREGSVVSELKEATAYEPNEDKEENFVIDRPEIAEIEKPEIELPEKSEEKSEETLLGSEEQEVDGPPFNEYSSGQLEAFYQDGDISAYTYSTEMDRREALREEVIEENRAFDKEMTEVSSVASRVEQESFAVDTAVNSESKIDVKERLAAVNNTDDDKKAAARVSEEEGRLWDYQLRA
jgi:hypothetical protein